MNLISCYSKLVWRGLGLGGGAAVGDWGRYSLATFILTVNFVLRNS